MFKSLNKCSFYTNRLKGSTFPLLIVLQTTLNSLGESGLGLGDSSFQVRKVLNLKLILSEHLLKFCILGTLFASL